GGAGVVAGEGAAVGVGDLHGAAGQRLVPRDVHRGRLAVVADEVEGGCYVDAGGGRLVDRDGVFGRRGRLQECGPHSQVGGDASGEGAAALGQELARRPGAVSVRVCRGNVRVDLRGGVCCCGGAVAVRVVGFDVRGDERGGGGFGCGHGQGGHLDRESAVEGQGAGRGGRRRG